MKNRNACWKVPICLSLCRYVKSDLDKNFQIRNFSTNGKLVATGGESSEKAKGGSGESVRVELPII